MKHNINQILDKYWEGETSVEEEILLKAYFKSGQIQEDHLCYASLFNYYFTQQEVACPIINDDPDVDKLLDKYWDGNSSIDEEIFLKNYFNSAFVHEKHQSFTPLFQYYSDQAKITFPEEKKNNVFNINKTFSFSIKRTIFAVAAVSLLVLGSMFVLKTIKPENKAMQTAMVHEIEDPEEALRVTKEALAMVSKKFRASQKSVRENMESLEKAAIFK